MNNEVEGRGYTKVHVLSLYLTGRAEENHENVSQDGQSLGDEILTWDLQNVKQQCQLLDHNIQSGTCTEVALGQIS